MKRLAFKTGPLLAALALAGCASISPDGLRGDVARHTEGRLPAGAQLPSPDAQALQDAQTQIADWLKALRGDKRAIFRAATAAQAASELILSHMADEPARRAA